MRSIKAITDNQKAKLLKIIDKSQNSRARKRAHAIIMSSEGDSIQKIANFYECDRDSVSSWLTRWENKKFDGLHDPPRSGRPAIIDKGLKKK